MSVEQFTQNVDESQQRMRQLLAMLDTGHEQGLSAQGELREVVAELEETSQRLNERFESISEHVESSDLEQPIEDVSQAAAELTEAVENRAEQVDAAIGEFVAAAETSREEVASVVESLESALENLNSRLEQASQRLSEIQDKVEEISTDHEGPFDHVNQTIEEAAAALDESVTTVHAALESLGSEVEGDLLGALNELFDSLDEVIETQLQGEVIESIVDFGQELTELTQDLDGEVDSLGEQLSERVREIFDNLREYATQEAEAAVTEALEKLIQEIVTAFAAEIVQAVMMTTVGVSTTSSLSYVLPYLVAAKKLLELINEVMDAVPG